MADVARGIELERAGQIRLAIDLEIDFVAGLQPIFDGRGRGRGGRRILQVGGLRAGGLLGGRIVFRGGSGDALCVARRRGSFRRHPGRRRGAQEPVRRPRPRLAGAPRQPSQDQNRPPERAPMAQSVQAMRHAVFYSTIVPKRKRRNAAGFQ